MMSRFSPPLTSPLTRACVSRPARNVGDVRAAVAVTRLIYDQQLLQALTWGSLVLQGADCTLPYVTAIKERHFSLPAAPAVLKRERKSEKRKRWQVAPRWLENGLLENQRREDEETWPKPLYSTAVKTDQKATT
ncbi:hypothetical protein RRG08_061504 [Elysia crispata]|uniref:Uncharacterized protein n=1 Tax=Elysia crispata TaxID=231223 RepID=A0AAE0XR83_9GAST|nr:hypothetical protein RRG08_061504 [Elysia crispata]